MSGINTSFRQNLQIFVYGNVKAPLIAVENKFDKLKEMFENKGLALLILTKQTYHDLHEATTASENKECTVNLDVRPLDLRKFKTDNDFNRLDRILVFNKVDNTVAFIGAPEEQDISLENMNVVLKLKSADKDSGEEQVFTNIHAKKLTQEDFDNLNQIVQATIKNLQVPKMEDVTSQYDLGEMKAWSPQTRGGRSKESKNTSESSKSEEKDLPASERETFVEAAEKIQKEMERSAREEHELEKAGEKRREAFIRNKKKVDFEKEQHRARVAANALKKRRRAA